MLFLGTVNWRIFLSFFTGMDMATSTANLLFVHTSSISIPIRYLNIMTESLEYLGIMLRDQI